MKKLLLVCMLLIMPVMAQADEAVWIERGIDDTYRYVHHYSAGVIKVFDEETGRYIKCIVYAGKYERGSYDGSNLTCPDFLNVAPTSSGTQNGANVNINK